MGKATAVKWKTVERSDGTPAHNLQVQENEKEILLRISKTEKPMMSSKNKPILGSSRGFVKIGDYSLNLNLMDKRSN